MARTIPEILATVPDSVLEYDDVMHKLSFAIYEALHEKNMSQEELAEKIKISKGRMKNILAGDTDMKVSEIASIACVLGKRCLFSFTDKRI